MLGLVEAGVEALVPVLDADEEVAVLLKAVGLEAPQTKVLRHCDEQALSIRPQSWTQSSLSRTQR